MFTVDGKMFVGFHTRFADHEAVDGLLKLIDQGLAPMGINALILEFNPGYSYRCFPEYSNGTVTYEDCVKIRDFCRERGIKAMPLFQCLSHQSDHMKSSSAWKLLKAHPEFDETPDVPDDAKWPDFYTHSWCAANDGIYEYVFPMMDELIEAFDTDVLHIGMDEVFDIASCPRCKDQKPDALFARTVKILHDHLAEKGVRTMMWGDRLLDAQKLGYQMWEADKFGMYPAFDRADEVTRDILITDWHYDLHDHGYPSVSQFMKGGFEVIPSLGSNPEQALHFTKFAMEDIYMGNKYGWPGRVAGLLFTQWKAMTAQGAEEVLHGISTGERSEEEFTCQNAGCVIKAVMGKYRDILSK